VVWVRGPALSARGVAYYTGDLDYDIEHSGIPIRTRDGTAQSYATLLRLVKDTAIALVRARKIKLSELPTRIDSPVGLVPVIKYMSTARRLKGGAWWRCAPP
jgi:hypothetical protein